MYIKILNHSKYESRKSSLSTVCIPTQFVSFSLDVNVLDNGTHARALFYEISKRTQAIVSKESSHRLLVLPHITATAPLHDH